MIDSWIARHPPARVIAALAPLVSEERKARIARVLGARLGQLTVVLENLHDPHNGAAALRSVEGFGLSELHVVEGTEPFRFSSKVSQGCEKWVAIARHRSFAACAAALHERGFRLHAALPGAATALEEIDVGVPTALCIGNEHAGLTPEAIAACDGAYAIPMAGFTQSFNLSVSVALSVHDTARRRRVVLGQPGDLDEAERERLTARAYALSMDERTAQGLVERDAG